METKTDRSAPIAHGGACGRLIAMRDRADTSLGVLALWPKSLLTTASTIGS